MRVEQYGGSPVKVGEEEYHLFRDSEYVSIFVDGMNIHADSGRILAKINE
jgi:hypothetical protein